MAAKKSAFDVTTMHKGLGNNAGENNCFLNVTIQALWHLGPFRVRLQSLISKLDSETERSTNKGLLNALCNLFIQYEFAEQAVLPPTELRESLSLLSSQFELGKIADANEALDYILHKIHEELRPPCPESQKCLSHEVFGGAALEQAVCRECGASSEPTVMEDFILCFQAVQLIAEAAGKGRPKSSSISKMISYPFSSRDREREDSEVGGVNSTGQASDADSGKELNGFFNSEFFGKFLNTCQAVSQRSCPSTDGTNTSSISMSRRCAGKANVFFYSLEPPLALALSVGWTNENETADVLHSFYSIIPYTIYLKDLFNIEGKGPSYVFRGLVCYYGLHYVSIFQEHHQDEDKPVQFLLFDDNNVRLIGNWSAVKKECIKSRYQPVLMLYELENGSYVDTTATSTATCSSSSTTVTQITTSTSSSSSSQPFSMPIESHRVLPTTTLVSVPKATHSDEKPAVSERKEESYKRLSGQVRESVTPPSQSKAGTRSEMPDIGDPIFNEEFIALQAAAFEKYEQQNQKIKEFEQGKEQAKEMGSSLGSVRLDDLDYEIISKSDFDTSPNLTADTAADKNFGNSNIARESKESSGGPKELSRNTSPVYLEAARTNAGLLKGSSPNYSTQADYDGGPKTNSTSNSSGTGSSTQNTRVTYNDNDSYQSLSGTKPSSSSSPTKFNNEDIYRRKYPELAPPIMNPTLTTANPYPGTSSGSPNPNPNPNPIRSEMSISESKVSTEIVGKSDLSRVQRVSERNDFDDFVFLDSNNDAIKHKVKKWQIRHRRYIVNLPYENDQFLTRDNTSVLGMQFGWNQNNLIMVGFYKNIRTGKMFPSQQCGDVRVGDRLDTAGDKNVKNSSISEWISQLHRNMNNRRWSSLVSGVEDRDKERTHVSFGFTSSYYLDLYFCCIHCNFYTFLDDKAVRLVEECLARDGIVGLRCSSCSQKSNATSMPHIP